MNVELDKACTGRLSRLSRLVLNDYRRFESTRDQRELHRFNTDGFIGVLDGDYPALSIWNGLKGFKKRLLNPYGKTREKWVVDYGQSTRRLFDNCMQCVSSGKVVLTDLFYSPWRSLIPGSRTDLDISCIEIRQSVYHGLPKKEIVDRIASEVVEQEADTLLISLVSQDGIRMPVEETVRAIVNNWRSTSRLPVILVDGCQGVGRVPFEIFSDQRKTPGLVVVGCLHKAFDGPKEVGFLISSDAYFRECYQRRFFTRNTSSNYVRSYAESSGQEPGLPTVDCGKLVAASVLLNAVDPKSIRRRFQTAAWHQMDLAQHLRSSEWRVKTPMNADLASGILLVDPPPALSRTHRHSLKELLHPVKFDEINGSLRFAFDHQHSEETVKVVSRKMKELSKLNRSG